MFTAHQSTRDEASFLQAATFLFQNSSNDADSPTNRTELRNCVNLGVEFVPLLSKIVSRPPKDSLDHWNFAFFQLKTLWKSNLEVKWIWLNPLSVYRGISVERWMRWACLSTRYTVLPGGWMTWMASQVLTAIWILQSSGCADTRNCFCVKQLSVSPGLSAHNDETLKAKCCRSAVRLTTHFLLAPTISSPSSQRLGSRCFLSINWSLRGGSWNSEPAIKRSVLRFIDPNVSFQNNRDAVREQGRVVMQPFWWREPLSR